MTTPQKLIDKALRDYAATKSVFKAAKRCGLGSTTVHRLLKANGVECDGLKLYRKSIRKLPDGPALIAEYNAGTSITNLAKKYACTYSTARLALLKTGVSLRAPFHPFKDVTQQEKAQMVTHYTELGSHAAVAVMMNMSPQRVSRILADMGIESRKGRGKEHPGWKGGRAIDGQGYMKVLVRADDPLACMRNGLYVLEHRLVVARALGRPLSEHETVHHINGVRSDNRLENLQLRQGKHGKGVVFVCKDCGSRNIGHTTI